VVAEGTDIAFVRELTGGVYFGRPSYRGIEGDERYAIDTGYYNERQIEDVLAFAFRLARSRRGRVTSVDKANVMNTSRLWREVATEYGRRHPDVTLEHALVDSFAMSLIQDPRRYDVVVTENLFGDILTDLAGVIAGSLGVLPSASLRPRDSFGMYEPIHGSAPDIAGRGIANPAGCILSAALMLRWSFGRHDLAAQVEDAVSATIGRGVLTADLAADDPAGTDAFAAAVIESLREGGESGEGRNLRYDVA
jgi:3-isopropylmalate dehydrogenase